MLEAALKLFARHGIAQTPLSAIAAEAGVTKAMIHYHFSTREKLLDVLIQERLLPLRNALIQGLAGHVDPIEALTAFARSLVAQARRYPWLPGLWLREVMSEGGLLRARMRAQLDATGERRTTALIEAWQRDGLISPALKPELVLMSVFGMTMLPLTVLGGAADAQAANAVAEHAVAMLRHGVREAAPGKRRQRA
ncbi:TetR family transcriptional regulator [Stenotrophomonas sp. HITSZ_GD]|nr:TetR family transcriptional regulator [Stenotrophomonas sp. HITSZ_GD]MDG2524260.1 TetR family transcriptional regulator [Stenotrophomonas sp. HITSZ_GD]